MALIKCTECGNELSSKAAICPHCGCPIYDILLDSISDNNIKEIIKIQTVKPKSEMQSKEDYLLDYGLYTKEYAPLLIKGECYAKDDAEHKTLIRFEKTAVESDLHYGSPINIMQQDGYISAIISKINFSENTLDDAEKVYTEYSKKYGIQRHYKKVLFEINDKDYQKILAIGNLNKSKGFASVANNKGSAVSSVNMKSEEEDDSIFTAKLLFGIGILIYIAGLIGGIGLYESLESVIPMIAVWASAFVSGTFLIGFAEVINLLNEINKNQML